MKKRREYIKSWSTFASEEYYFQTLLLSPEIFMPGAAVLALIAYAQARKIK